MRDIHTNFYKHISDGAFSFQVGKTLSGSGAAVCIYDNNEMGMRIAFVDNSVRVYKHGFVCVPAECTYFIRSMQITSLLHGNEIFVAKYWQTEEEAYRNALELTAACGSSAKVMSAKIFLDTGEDFLLLNINKESILTAITETLAKHIFFEIRDTEEKCILSEELKDVCFNTVSSFLRNVFGQGFLDSQRSAAPLENVTTVASSENVEFLGFSTPGGISRKSSENVENFHSWEDHVLESHNSTENPTAAFNNMSQRSKCCGDNKSL